MASLAFSSALSLRIAPLSSGAQVSSNKSQTTMISASRNRRAENVPGDVYVDSKCIDCDTCRWLAPDTFHRAGSQSAVHKQPEDEKAKLQALQAAAACPTASIRTMSRSPLSAEAARTFPLPAPNSLTGTLVPDVYYNGFTSEMTFGCSSWLLLNRGKDPYAVMFDVPRFNKLLLKAIQKMTEPFGGVRYLVLSHMDDVAGHEQWAKALGAERIMHSADANMRQGTDACEIQLKDADFPYKLSDGCEILHVPGHTKGCIALLHHATNSLFTGDHLFYSLRTGLVAGSEVYCFYSFEEQIKSVNALRDVPFLHGWPGHGRHFHFKNAQDREEQIDTAVEFMKSVHSRAPVWA